MDKWFYKLNQTAATGSFQFVDIDLSWLKSLGKDAYCQLNIASHVHCPVVPQGRDLYVLSWFFEPFGDLWFLDLYNKNPQAEFVVISDMRPNSLLDLDRVKFFQITHHSTWLRAMQSRNTRPTQTSLANRKYKLSSLSARLNEFKFYVTAKLYDRQHPDTLYTWNRDFSIRNEDGFVFDPKGFHHIDRMLAHKDFLRENSINAEDFSNTPLDNSCFEHPAYLDTVINSVNESLSLSTTPEFGNLPGPFITEKTWKPLFAGNAVLFTGQAGLKQQLESWGFRFDYVWAQDYDDSFNDNQRLETILGHINWILEIPLADLAAMCQESVDHNLELAWSGKLEQRFRYSNDMVMQDLKKHLNLL